MGPCVLLDISRYTKSVCASYCACTSDCELAMFVDKWGVVEVVLRVSSSEHRTGEGGDSVQEHFWRLHGCSLSVIVDLITADGSADAVHQLAVFNFGTTALVVACFFLAFGDIVDVYSSASTRFIELDHFLA